MFIIKPVQYATQLTPTQVYLEQPHRWGILYTLRVGLARLKIMYKLTGAMTQPLALATAPTSASAGDKEASKSFCTFVFQR